ncbi:MAG: hypothetical protein KAG61_05875 [Bacteriovoracaceae bacterium]|nr:hypothetical protein [Bacteriovoracaceae bacterium]
MNKIIIAFTLLASFAASANTVELNFTSGTKLGPVEFVVDQDYLQVAAVELTELRENAYVLGDLDQADDYINKISKVTGSLIALGKEIWPLIVAGRPVINTDFKDSISVIPNLDGTGKPFEELNHWSAPESRSFLIEYKNLYGMVVVSFEFSVNAQHSGSYKGKGQYLTGVTIVPNDIYVAWGFSLDASSKMINITNRGSKEDPIAAVTLEVDYKVDTIIEMTHAKSQFHIVGNGDFIQLN